MQLSTGIDLIEIDRIQTVIARHGQRYLQRIFTPLELEESAGRVESLAARFAAKEATAKALGCGIGEVGWQEIEIQRGESQRPILVLTGKAAERAEKLGLATWSVSLSHSQTYAVAMVVAIGE